MNEELLLEYNNEIKSKKILIKEGCAIFKRASGAFDGDTIHSVIGFINMLHKKYPNINMPISLEFGEITFVDKLTYIMLEVICYILINKYHHNVYVKFKSKNNIFTDGIESSPLLLLKTGEKEHVKKFIEKYKFEIFKKHYRRLLSQDDMRAERLSIIMSEITFILGAFSVSEKYVEEISEVIIELIGNVSEHTDASCLVDIDITADTYTKRGTDGRFFGINLVVLNFSHSLFNESIKRRILLEEMKPESRYQQVKDAYEFHNCNFDKEYMEDDFFNIAAFQHRISGNNKKEITGGTGLTKLIHSLEKRSDAHQCYLISGNRGLWFVTDLLEYNKDYWIGFNKEKNFLSQLPEKRIFAPGSIFMPGTAYNLNFVMKGKKR